MMMMINCLQLIPTFVRVRNTEIAVVVQIGNLLMQAS